MHSQDSSGLKSALQLGAAPQCRTVRMAPEQSPRRQCLRTALSKMRDESGADVYAAVLAVCGAFLEQRAEPRDCDMLASKGSILATNVKVDCLFLNVVLHMLTQAKKLPCCSFHEREEPGAGSVEHSLDIERW